MSADQSTDERLQDLPEHVRDALLHLRDIHPIGDEVLMDVLDAGELAGGQTQLLGFALAFMLMSSRGVPVRDTIRMAKMLGRRLNLRWSEKRWREEHNRLWRAAILKRLAAENVRYDLSAFDVFIPSHLHGYLIRSSRRLGMEGWRQCHCVADYHWQIQSGRCAFAVVFIDQDRYTVQLCPGPSSVQPIRIAQVKKRFNRDASGEVRNRIRLMFGLAPDSVISNDAGEISIYHENLRKVLSELRRLGVCSVNVGFDGCGDEGSLDAASFHPPLTADVNATVEVMEFVLVKGAEGTVRKTTLARRCMRDAITVLAGQFVDQTGVDWYTNAGGFGEVVIDVSVGTLSVQVSTRRTAVETEYSRTFDIETEQQLYVSHLYDE